jgi:hypothetical protein
MIKEWLLIVYVGTTTNFTLLDYFPSKQSCMAELKERSEDFRDPLILLCTDNLSEGRSELPKRSHSTGLVK